MMNRNTATGANPFDEMRLEFADIAEEAESYARELSEEPALAFCAQAERSNLAYAVHILRENAMPVGLSADSAGGKTTTSTAVADGEEVSPAGRGGGGIRTSAVPVTIYHHPTQTAPELLLYDEEALVEQVLQSVGPFLDPKRREPYRLTSLEDRDLLQKALEQEIDLYQHSVKSGAAYPPSRLALLRNTILILSFYGSPAYLALLDGRYDTVTKIQSFIAFAPDEEKRWTGLSTRGLAILRETDELGKPLFDPEEVLHVFVQSVRVPVQSEFMHDTGTAFIDPPGTAVSAEDTRRALRAAHEAAVVLMILADHQLTEYNREYLQTLRRAGLADKVIFAVNFRRPVQTLRNAGIEDALLTAIRAEGYTAPHQQKLLYYNAFLAARAAQGRLLLRGDMSELTRKGIMEDALVNGEAPADVTDAWISTTVTVLYSVGMRALAREVEAKGLCEDVIEQISQASRWKETVLALRTHVMDHRTVGILRDLGAQPVYRSLSAMENGLKKSESMAQQDEEQAREIHAQAKALLEDFSGRIQRVLKSSFNESIDQALAEDYYQKVVMGAVPLASQRVARDIFEENDFWNTVVNAGQRLYQHGVNGLNWIAKKISGHKLVKDYEFASINDRCQAMIRYAYDVAMSELAVRWSNELTQSSVYDQNVMQRLTFVKEEFARIWKELQLDRNSLLKGVDPLPVEITGDLSRDILSARHMYKDLSEGLNNNFHFSPATVGVMAGLGTVAGVCYIYLFVMPLDVVIPFFGCIVAVLATLVYSLVTYFNKKAGDNRVDRIAQDLQTGMTAELAQNRQETIEAIKRGTKEKPGVRMVREFYTDVFNAMLATQRNNLETNYNNTLKQFKLSLAERARIADLARTWRTEKIEPLRMRLKAAMDKAKKIWG